MHFFQQSRHPVLAVVFTCQSLTEGPEKFRPPYSNEFRLKISFKKEQMLYLTPLLHVPINWQGSYLCRYHYCYHKLEHVLHWGQTYWII